MPKPSIVWEDPIVRVMAVKEAPPGEGWNFKPQVFKCLADAGISHQEGGDNEEEMLVIDGNGIEYFFKEEGGKVSCELYATEEESKKILDAGFKCFIRVLTRTGGRKTKKSKGGSRKTRRRR